MGQFGNQPDFATNDIKEVAPDNNINQSTFLDSSIVYIGDNTTSGTTGCMVVIPAGTVGPSVISGFSSPGYHWVMEELDMKMLDLILIQQVEAALV